MASGGGGTPAFDLSGLAVRLRGLPEPHATRLRADWRAFAADEAGLDPFLDLEVEAAAEAADPTPFGAKEMTAHFDGERARYAFAEGEAEVPLRGPVRVRLGATTREKQYFALLNLTIAAAAWRLPSRGGALLHAAGIVLDGRAFVLVGAEGAGKTTWTLLARDGGAGVLSDDLVVVAPGPAGGLEALSTPFRSAQYGTLPAGRWPLAAFLLPVHRAAAALEPAAPLALRARLTANLPFVVEAIGRDPRISELPERLAAAAPARTLAFARDPSFLPLLRGFAPPSAARPDDSTPV